MLCSVMVDDVLLCCAALPYGTLRYVMVWYAMLCDVCGMICYVVLCYVFLRYDMCCYAMLWYVMLWRGMCCCVMVWCGMICNAIV